MEHNTTNRPLVMPDSFIGTPLEEQETVINWLRTDDVIQIYTSDNTMLTKLKKLMASGPDQYTLTDVGYYEGNPCSVTVTTQLRCLSLRAGNKRDLSEEERQALSDRMKQITANRQAAYAATATAESDQEDQK